MVEFGESVGYHNRSPDEEERSKKELSRSSLRFYRSFECSPYRSLWQKERSWNEKVAEMTAKKRYMTAKRVICVLMLAICFTLTMVEQPYKVQASSYLVTLAVFFVTDPIVALDIFLAPQTRRILAVMCLVATAAIWKTQRDILIVAGVMVAAGIFLIKKLNVSWLANYNWLLSDEVEKVLMMDSDNISVMAWQAHGKRATRTLLYKLGLDIGGRDQSEEILDVLHKPVYLLGYIYGLEKTVNYHELEDELEKVNAEVGELKEEIKMLQSDKKRLEKELEESDVLIKTNDSTVDYWRNLYQKERQLNEQLQRANEEILESVPSEEALKERAAVLKEMTLEERVLMALENGMSYQEVADFAGCSKTTVSRIKKKKENESKGN